MAVIDPRVHHHDIAEISLQVALNAIPPQIVHLKITGIRIDNFVMNRTELLLLM
jgi:hypothetical protein